MVFLRLSTSCYSDFVFLLRKKKKFIIQTLGGILHGNMLEDLLVESSIREILFKVAGRML